jgi:energy-coupling factor transporter ATP-binding protein EcfA2
MKLIELRCAGVRGLADGRYSFADPRTGAPLPVTLITGAPASGKSTLLEAIAAAKEVVGAYGTPPDPKRLLRPGARDARITATWLLSADERDRAGVDEAEQTVTWELGSLRTDAAPGLRGAFAAYSRSPEHAKLEYFPANRRIEPRPRSAFGLPSVVDPVRTRATRAPDKYAGVIDGLREIVAAQAARAADALEEDGVALRRSIPDALQPYKEAVAAVLPALRLQGFDEAAGSPRFIRRTREVVGLDELSDSERQRVLFALAFRYLGLRGSLVLIDEPELHLHAMQHADMLHALVGLGQENQIIAATGSAALLRAAGPGQVIDLSRTG